MKKASRVDLVLAIVVLLGAFLACGKGGSSSTGSGSAPATKTAPIGIVAAELLKDYKENEVAADAKYKGKRLITGGLVGDIKKDIMDKIYVTVGTAAPFEIPKAQCFFDDASAGQIATLKKGQTIIVDCECEGLMMNVIMRNCTLKSVK